MAGSNGEFSFPNESTTPPGGLVTRKSLPRIQTHSKNGNGIGHADSAPPVKAQTIDELHSLQKKKSTPTTPIGAFTPPLSDEERQKQQLKSIRSPSWGSWRRRKRRRRSPIFQGRTKRRATQDG